LKEKPLNAENILTADRISLTLSSKAGSVKILHDVNLHIKPGERVGIVGRSGSGKSSLLSLLAGLEKPTQGKIQANGFGLSGMDEEALARFRRRSVGFIFQSFHLIATMTALENVALPLEFIGDRKAFEKARSLLAKVGLSERTEHYPDQLSGGEQQRVAISRAVIGHPPILLADEPTGNLDENVGGKIADMLFALQRENKSALILVTHDLELAARCDRVLEMVDGRLIAANQMGKQETSSTSAFAEPEI